jgi:hypothetical protein
MRQIFDKNYSRTTGDDPHISHPRLVRDVTFAEVHGVRGLAYPCPKSIDFQLVDIGQCTKPDVVIGADLTQHDTTNPGGLLRR